MKRIASLLLSLLVILSFTAVGFADNDVEVTSPWVRFTDSNGKIDYSPVNLSDIPGKIAEAQQKGSSYCTVGLNGKELALDQEIMLTADGFQLTIKDGKVNGKEKRAFYLKGDGITLIIKDLTVYNCKSDDGGAVYVEGKECTIKGESNATFEKNKSTNCGGAIRMYGDGGTISRLHFNENKADDDGGAILSEGYESIIDGCSFDSNETGDAGGAIYTWNNTKIHGCGFKNSIAGCRSGKDIYAADKDTYVTSCGSNDSDGVVKVYGTKHIEYTEFTSSIFSQGNIWIIAAVAVIFIAAAIALFVRKRKNS